MHSTTPVEQVGDLYLKRDDLYVGPGGAPGGKARTCAHIIQTGLDNYMQFGNPLQPFGVVTAGSRSSPQVNIVAQICYKLGLGCRVHTPTGKPGPEVEAAIAVGAFRIEHFPGYNTVLVKRAHDDADRLRWIEVPFGMDTIEAVRQTATQVENVPDDVVRIVVPVGSGMSLCGIIAGLDAVGRRIPLLGVVVGADPTKRLDKYAPGWRFRDIQLVRSGLAYETPYEASIGGVVLDPIYEAKTVPFLRPGDLLWLVGIRQTLVHDS